MSTWERVARNYAVAYPENGIAIGIGPIADQRIAVRQNDFSGNPFVVLSPDARLKLTYESGTVEIESL